jgi:uncharacterized caspase-like protein
MTLDKAMQEIREADPGQVVEVAESCVSRLSNEDREIAGDDLINTAILRSLIEGTADE